MSFAILRGQLRSFEVTSRDRVLIEPVGEGFVETAAGGDVCRSSFARGLAEEQRSGKLAVQVISLEFFENRFGRQLYKCEPMSKWLSAELRTLSVHAQAPQQVGVRKQQSPPKLRRLVERVRGTDSLCWASRWIGFRSPGTTESGVCHGLPLLLALGQPLGFKQRRLAQFNWRRSSALTRHDNLTDPEVSTFKQATPTSIVGNTSAISIEDSLESKIWL